MVLDPGHGGNEAGANRTWNGVLYEEKVINLKISKYTAQELEKYAGVTVYLTRTGDTTFPSKTVWTMRPRKMRRFL